MAGLNGKIRTAKRSTKFIESSGDFMENKIKHLEMIQSIITRMAQNSFMIKGWSLTLVVAMFAFVPKTACLFVPIVIIPVLIFTCLDAYYLQLERRYRKLYDIVREKEESDVDFNLKITDQCKQESNKYCKCLFTKSILFFYLPVLIVCVGIILALFL